MKLLQLQEELLEELATVLGRDVDLDEELLGEGGFDSFSIMQLVTSLEDRYGIRIPDERLAASSFTNARVISDWLLLLDRAR